MITHLLVNTLYGSIAGTVWAFALGNSLKYGLLYGAIVGVILGFLLSLMDKSARASGRISKSEAIFVTTSQSTMLLFVAIVTALIAFIIRIIFF